MNNIDKRLPSQHALHRCIELLYEISKDEGGRDGAPKACEPGSAHVEMCTRSSKRYTRLFPEPVSLASYYVRSPEYRAADASRLRAAEKSVH